MANILAPFGFRQAGTLEGPTPSFGQTPRSILRTNASPIFKGDPVSLAAGGSTTNLQGQRYIQQATPGTGQIDGIFVGCKYQSISQANRPVWSQYWPGNGDALADPVAYVVTAQDQVFRVQANGQLLPSHVGLNCNFAIGTGTPATGLSGAMIDVSTIAATATLPFRIVELVEFVPGANGSDITSPYGFALVRMNNVDSRALTGI